METLEMLLIVRKKYAKSRKCNDTCREVIVQYTLMVKCLKLFNFLQLKIDLDLTKFYLNSYIHFYSYVFFMAVRGGWETTYHSMEAFTLN